MLQVWLALTGDLAKAFINYEGPGKPLHFLNQAYSSSGAGSGSGAGAGAAAAAEAAAAAAADKGGTVLDSTFDSSLYSKAASRVAENERRGVAAELARFLFTGSPAVAYPLAASVCAAVLWADGQAARRATKLATASWS